MSVSIKSEHEIELMREAGRILAIVHDEMAKIIRPGVSTMDINRRGEDVIRSFKCIPSFLNYNGYPAAICISVNDEVVHGIGRRYCQPGCWSDLSGISVGFCQNPCSGGDFGRGQTSDRYYKTKLF